MARRKKFEKLSDEQLKKIRETKNKELQCKKCGRWVYDVSIEAEEVLCHICTSNLVPILPKDANKPSGFPRGWKLWKEYVHADGIVYHKGIEQPHLKGKITPTDVEAWKKEKNKNKLSKKQKEELKATREAKLVKQFEQKKAEQKKTKTKEIDIDLPAVKTNKEIITAIVSLDEGGIYRAIDGEIDYTALVNDQKKLKYVFGNSKKIMGKRNSDKTYNWRGCK